MLVVKGKTNLLEYNSAFSRALQTADVRHLKTLVTNGWWGEKDTNDIISSLPGLAPTKAHIPIREHGNASSISLIIKPGAI